MAKEKRERGGRQQDQSLGTRLCPEGITVLVLLLLSFDLVMSFKTKVQRQTWLLGYSVL